MQVSYKLDLEADGQLTAHGVTEIMLTDEERKQLVSDLCDLDSLRIWPATQTLLRKLQTTQEILDKARNG